jgi:hypothetical protein
MKPTLFDNELKSSGRKRKAEANRKDQLPDCTKIITQASKQARLFDWWGQCMA